MENINIDDIFGERRKYYDSIPVAYCDRCLSLNIRTTIDNEDYCDSCGALEMKYGSIDEWKELAANKYGKEFIIDSKYGRN
jgi:hypothetical protein